MKQNQLNSIANKYCVEDLRDSLTPGTALSNVISRLELAPDYIPETTKDYLRKSKLNALLQYACKQIAFDEFKHSAKSEQEKRKLESEKHRKEQAKQAEINAERRREQQKIHNLLKGYDIYPSDVKLSDGQKLRDILEKVNSRIRLSQDELAWLMVSRGGLYSGYYTQILREKYHRIEAEYYLVKYQKSQNPWDIINSSSHFRKCNCANKANSFLTEIDSSKFKAKKIESAFNTTYGGVKRDLGAYNEAIALGNKAHTLTPNDFRPCTLLGAVNIEMGHYDEGQSWYQKAIERGATEKSVDDDLRSIFKRSEKSKCKDLALFLLKREPERYDWVKKYLK
jgi:tetratricopeptide (TPR) repeat protein